MNAKKIAKNDCSWNYYVYNIIEVIDDSTVIYEECGEDLNKAKARLMALRSGLSFFFGRKFFIQEQHFVSHIL